MSIDRFVLTIQGTPIEVVRKDIKNLHVGVYPPEGRVRVAAPMRMNDEAVRLALVSRLAWIRRHQKGFEGQVRQSEREMVNGESHYYFGHRYRLEVVEIDRTPSVSLPNSSTMRLSVRPGTDRDGRHSVLVRWYRFQLKDILLPTIDKWEPIVGVRVNEVRVKKMKTRWGSCNIEDARIWINLELAKKPRSCAEYIIVHEMIHLLERHHTDRFRSIMDSLMPNWRTIRDELNRSPLAHEQWQY